MVENTLTWLITTSQTEEVKPDYNQLYQDYFPESYNHWKEKSFEVNYYDYFIKLSLYQETESGLTASDTNFPVVTNY